MHWQHPLKQQQPQQQLLQGRWQRRQLTSAAVEEAAKHQTRETATTGSLPHQRTNRRPSPLTGAASPTGARQVGGGAAQHALHPVRQHSNVAAASSPACADVREPWPGPMECPRCASRSSL